MNEFTEVLLNTPLAHGLRYVDEMMNK